MTKFHTNGEELLSADPFERPEPQPTGRIVFTTPEEKPMLNARTLTAAFWASYFALHWLLILEVIESSPQRSGTALFFFVFAVLLTIHIDATWEKKK